MRVWVTRDEDENGALCTSLRAVGLTPVCEPVLERRVVNDAADVISRLGPDDWLVLTSVYAVEAVAVEPARVPRVAVVSEPSRLAAEARGFRVDLVSPRGDGKSLFEALRAKATSGTVCYPRSSLVNKPEPWPGIDLLSPVLYETVPRAFDASVINRVDVIAVASPSAVDAIGAAGFSPRGSAGKGNVGTSLDMVQEDGKHPSPRGDASVGRNGRTLRFASIGPTTSAALRKHAIEPWLEAPDPSFKTLATAVAAKA